MKHIIILGDGMSDYPVARLGNKTPLQVARKPSIDRIAREGRCGMFKTIEEDVPTGSEAANLAVQGYGPGQELLVLLGQGLRQDPDVVVLAFCLDNDFADAVLPFALYGGRTPKPRFRLDGDRLVLDTSSLRRTAPQRVAQWLSDYSYLFNRLSALGPQVKASGGPHWTTLKHEALRDDEYALRLCLAIVRRMDTVCRERGISFVVAAFPHWYTYRSKGWLHARFLGLLSGEGIAVLDMSERFKARGLRFWDVALDLGGHLSPRGHLFLCGHNLFEDFLCEHCTLSHRTSRGVLWSATVGRGEGVVTTASRLARTRWGGTSLSARANKLLSIGAPNEYR